MVAIFDQHKSEGKKTDFGLVLSIGTGKTEPQEVENMGVYVYLARLELSKILKAFASFGSTFVGVYNLLQFFITQSTQTD